MNLLVPFYENDLNKVLYPIQKSIEHCCFWSISKCISNSSCL